MLFSQFVYCCCLHVRVGRCDVMPYSDLQSVFMSGTLRMHLHAVFVEWCLCVFVCNRSAISAACFWGKNILALLVLAP